MSQLGVVLLQREKFEEAEALLRKALTLQQKLKGEGHPETLDTLYHLAGLLKTTGRLDEAEGLCRKELRISEEKFGPLNPETLASVSNLARLLEKQGNFEEAEQLYRRALTGSRQALGPAQPYTLRSAGDLVIYLEKRGRLAESEALFCLLIAAVDDKLEEETWGLMEIYSNWLKTGGQIDEAVTVCTRALGAQQRTLGHEHPQTKLLVRVLRLFQETAQSNTNDTVTASTASSVEQPP